MASVASDPLYKRTGLLNVGVLDNIYGVVNLALTRNKFGLFFSEGWGSFEAIEAVRRRFLSSTEPAPIDVRWDTIWQKRQGYYSREGSFDIPLFGEYAPPECRRSHFRVLAPDLSASYPVVIHFATTGEEGFEKREKATGRWLTERGIGVLILEAPYSGRRRPADRSTTRLRQFAELILLGGISVAEGCSLLMWLKTEGFTRLGLTGISMGGHLAALTAPLTPFPVACIPCVAPHSGIEAFVNGLLSTACDWAALGPDEQAARQKARELLAFTDIETLAALQAPRAAIIVAADNDRFVSKRSVEAMERHWQGAEVRWIKGGHVSSIAFRRRAFLHAIRDAMARI